ncbi:uncharacterized protein [Lepisosteus oculatus]
MPGGHSDAHISSSTTGESRSEAEPAASRSAWRRKRTGGRRELLRAPTGYHTSYWCLSSCQLPAPYQPYPWCCITTKHHTSSRSPPPTQSITGYCSCCAAGRSSRCQLHSRISAQDTSHKLSRRQARSESHSSAAEHSKSDSKSDPTATSGSLTFLQHAEQEIEKLPKDTPTCSPAEIPETRNAGYDTWETCDLLSQVISVNTRQEPTEPLLSEPGLHTESSAQEAPPATALGAPGESEETETASPPTETRDPLGLHAGQKMLQNQGCVQEAIEDSLDPHVPPAPQLSLRKVETPAVRSKSVSFTTLPAEGTHDRMCLCNLEDESGPSQPKEKSPLEKLTLGKREILEMHVTMKWYQVANDKLPDAVRDSYAVAFPVMKSHTPKAIPRGTTSKLPRPKTVPFMNQSDLGCIEANVRHRHIKHLWRQAFLHIKALKVKSSKAQILNLLPESPDISKELQVDVLPTEQPEQQLLHEAYIANSFVHSAAEQDLLKAKESLPKSSATYLREDSNQSAEHKPLSEDIHSSPTSPYAVWDTSDQGFREPSLDFLVVSQLLQESLDSSMSPSPQLSQSQVSEMVQESLDSSMPPSPQLSQSQVSEMLQGSLDSSMPPSLQVSQSQVSEMLQGSLDSSMSPSPQLSQSQVSEMVQESLDSSMSPSPQLSQRDVYPKPQYEITVQASHLLFMDEEHKKALERNVKRKIIRKKWRHLKLIIQATKVFLPDRLTGQSVFQERKQKRKCLSEPEITSSGKISVSFNTLPGEWTESKMSSKHSLLGENKSSQHKTPLETLGIEKRAVLEMHVTMKCFQISHEKLPLTVQYSYALAFPVIRHPLEKLIAPGATFRKTRPKTVLFMQEARLDRIEENIRYKRIRHLWREAFLHAKSLKTADSQSLNRPGRSTHSTVGVKVHDIPGLPTEQHCPRRDIMQQLCGGPSVVDRGVVSLESRQNVIGFLVQQAVVGIEMNLRIKKIEHLLGVPTPFTMSLAQTTPKCPPLPSSAVSRGTVVEFEGAGTPFFSEEARNQLEFHIQRKKLQQHWGLPKRVQESLEEFIPPAPQLNLSQAFPKPLYDITVELGALTFFPEEHKTTVELNVKRKIIQKKWRYPKLQITSIKAFLPPPAVSQDLLQQKPLKSSSKPNERKPETTTKLTQHAPRHSDKILSFRLSSKSLKKLKTNERHRLEFSLLKKCMEIKFERLPKMVSGSYRTTFPLIKETLKKIIAPGMRILITRPQVILFMDQNVVDQIEMNLKRKHVEQLLGLPTPCTAPLTLSVPKSPRPPPPVLPRGAPVDVKGMDTAFFSAEFGDRLEFHITRKKIQQQWGLPKRIQGSLEGFMPPAPLLTLSRMLPKPHYDIVVDLSDLPFISEQHRKAVEFNVRRKIVHKHWGYPKLVIVSVKSMTPPATVVQDLHTKGEKAAMMSSSTDQGLMTIDGLSPSASGKGSASSPAVKDQSEESVSQNTVSSALKEGVQAVGQQRGAPQASTSSSVLLTPLESEGSETGFTLPAASVEKFSTPEDFFGPSCASSEESIQANIPAGTLPMEKLEKPKKHALDGPARPHMKETGLAEKEETTETPDKPASPTQGLLSPSVFRARRRAPSSSLGVPRPQRGWKRCHRRGREFQRKLRPGEAEAEAGETSPEPPVSEGSEEEGREFVSPPGRRRAAREGHSAAARQVPEPAPPPRRASSSGVHAGHRKSRRKCIHIRGDLHISGTDLHRIFQ